MPPPFIPRHRRPSRISHRANLEAAFSRKKTPAMPPDGDTFYYNEAFISEWIMPADLWVRLPFQLTTEVKTWQAAGAAVLTVLARYDKLELEAPARGWPEKTNRHLSRTNSHASPALQSPVSPIIKAPSQGDSSSLPPLMIGLRARKDSSMPAIIDTPPFTPQDCGIDDVSVCEDSEDDGIRKEADLNQVNSRLANYDHRDSEVEISEISSVATPCSRRSSAASDTTLHPVFDEASWDVYINSCKAELHQLRTETLVRFRHLGRAIDRLWINLQNEASQHILISTSVEFAAWWKDMTEKALQCEEEARGLELPDLEEVKLERAAQGLPT